MTKLLLLFVILTTSVFALTPKQIATCSAAYQYGAKYELGNTLAAIVYVESKCGLYKVGYTGDFGATQINVASLLKEINVPNTHLNRSRYATKLIENDIYSFQLAIEELLFWKLKANRTDWTYMVASYNQGTVVQDFSYAQKIVKAIQYLKQQGIIK